MSNPVLDRALEYEAAGLSLIPIATDGTKKPSIRHWKKLQRERAGPDQLRKWFDVETPPGIGILGGEVSGNVETIDFDRGELWR